MQFGSRSFCVNQDTCSSQEIEADENDIERTVGSDAHSQSSLQSSSRARLNLSLARLIMVTTLTAPLPSIRSWQRLLICTRSSLFSNNRVTPSAIALWETSLNRPR